MGPRDVFTGEEVASQARSLSPITLAHLYHHVLRGPPRPSQVPAGAALVVWLANCLAVLRLLSPEALIYLIDSLSGPIEKAGQELALRLDADEMPVYQVGLADRRWGMFTGIDRRVDLEQGGWVEGLPEGELWMHSVNLTTLFVTAVTAIENGRRRPNSDDPLKP